MVNANYCDVNELKAINFSPETPYDAHLRIEEAERGISEGRVVSHEEVLRHSYELLERHGC